MFCVVFGILQAGNNNTLLIVFLAVGVAFLAGFFSTSAPASELESRRCCLPICSVAAFRTSG